MESVDCSECGHKYDSQEHPFCPRCGSQRSGPSPDAVKHVRQDGPAKRRVQAGGVMLAVIGAVAFAQLLFSAISTAEPDDETLELLSGVDLFQGLPGGDITWDLPPGDHPFVLQAIGSNQTIAGNATNGTVQELPSAFAQLNITVDGVDHGRRLYIPEGEHATVSADGEEWIASSAPSAVRGLAGFLAFFAAIVILGGVMAIKLRYRKLVYLGCGIALVPGLFTLILVPAVGLFLLALPAIATGLIVAGRSQIA